MSDGLRPDHVLDYVVRPALAALGLPGGLVAERLVLATGAHESMGFSCLHQLGGGPALGLFQMEPATFSDLWGRYSLQGGQGVDSNPLGWKLRGLLQVRTSAPAAQLTFNLQFAAAMCRVHYYARPFAMPTEAAPEDLAIIWKNHYNTSAGKGEVGQFLSNYRRYVAPLYKEA